ncbi:tetratricopeptide repeat protein [Erythrobacter sp. CCH5-A1]|jgi:Tfp pilus assembly protein PilF|uniref:tetratricopeptide repeat protein n=1 Tax=Erythrobacter sp. CCH5-A1 TaxID=1768792 RepID=UPI0008306522|nr:tetratricopeptide repeat protein [Erythrobacter sp. CCH5-A1]
MTFRPSALAALAAVVALALAGCSQGPPQPPRRAIGQGGAAFTRLLAEADGAMAKGALADAGRKLDEARSLAPESPDLWLAIARLRLRGGEHLTALEAADRALAFGPDYAPALRLRALLVRDAHGAADSLVWFEAARRAVSDDPDTLADYAATLGDGGEARASLKAARALAAAAPDDARAPYIQAVLAARGGQFTIARSLLGKSGMATRGVPAALLLDALISLEEGNADSAAAILEALAARQPANARVRELLARALFEGGRDADLVRRFGPEASLPEASPYLLMLVARAYERLGDRTAAAPLLARAYAPYRAEPVLLALRDGLPPPANAIRRMLWNGNAAGARAEAAALREKFPASADVAALAGDALLGAGDPRGALTSYALASEARRPWPLTRKAVWTFARHGNRGAAEMLLARQVAGETENASALAGLAEWQAARGDWRRTALLIDHALALGAGHDPALLALRERAAREAGDTAAAERFAALLAELRPRSLTAK